VLIVRLGSLGDLVHTLPAVAAIRRAHPDAAIDWLVDRPYREFLALVPVLSSIVVLEGRTPADWWRARGQLRSRRYDAAVDFQGLVKSAALARLSGARRVIGFDRNALREPAAASLYHERVAAGEGRHVIWKNLRLAGALDAFAEVPEFPIRRVDSPVLDDLQARGFTEFVLLNCGAAWPNKRYPADRLGRLAAWLQDRHRLRSLVIWGPGEQTIAAAVAAASGGAAALASETRLTDLVALARAAVLMVSGDTGPTHIAAAVGTPLVTVFGPTDPDRNGPWSPDDERLSRYESCACHYKRACRLEAHDWCLGRIAIDEVEAAITRRLARAAGAVRPARRGEPEC
jgi:lipopolysaccharide heptosyltransferase I